MSDNQKKPPVWIKVTILIDTIVEDVRVGDHNDYRFRRWMGKAAWWAMRHDRIMVTQPCDAPTETDKETEANGEVVSA